MSDERRWPDLSRTVAALAEHDRERPPRMAAWNTADTNAAVRACTRADADAWKMVTDAFAEDTADRNSRYQAGLVDEKTLREWVAKWEAER